MRLNLDTLKGEFLDSLEAGGFVVFHGHPRHSDSVPEVYWDSDRYPDHKMFLDAGKQAGAKMVVFHHLEFSPELLDNALERLEDSDPADEQLRNLERRLRELRAFVGFTCALELSFDHQGRIYVYEVRSDWYEDFLDILDEIDASVPDEEDGEEGPMGGYFSRN